MIQMKRHCCKVPGCGKAFSRPSHLQRHALNHSDTQLICERCNACFKRLDLLERHKARHAIRDKRAGGVGLGILETKSKHFKASSVSGSNSVLSPQQSSAPSPTGCQLSPPPNEPHDTNLTHTPSNDSNSVPFLSQPSSEHWTAAQGLQASELSTDYLSSQLNYSNSSQVPSMYHLMDQSPGLYEMGNMYHDMTFDLVHFNVTGFAPQLSDYRPSAPQSLPEAVQAPHNGGNQLMSLIQSPINNDSLIQQRRESHFSSVTSGSPNAIALTDENVRQDQGRRMSDHAAEDVIRTPIVESIFSSDIRPDLSKAESSSTGASPRANPVLDSRPNEPTSEVHEIRRSHSFTSDKPQLLSITTEKRDEILDFIADIGPVRPDGTLIDADDFSLENMQTYLDLFFEFFNTSYPLIHVATLDVSDTDPIALLSLMILGATYKDKDAHQLSVCVYDAIVPYILSGLLSGPVPDLSILQAFLVLECYGMYRAGPYQRENAILIHGLLLNSIRRISRYHVRARITLPDRLTHKERDWMEFAYAEQYKRLILFFFIWDTQNATCYSFMPNMSIQSLQIGLPCDKKLWEATNGSEWKELLSEHDDSSTLLEKVKKFVNNDHQMLQKPYDSLSFNLALHGLMSMANDMLHFDNRSIYSGDPQKMDVSWSPWQQQIAQSLESWKAKYDAFAMEIIFEMHSEPLHCKFQRDSMAIFALYHTAHIVINCEICHLQTAAGAKAIFGHIVTPSDYEESCKWVRNWVRNSPESAGRAAWHAAQMFREGMLNLVNWDVHGVFHYPWCLYIGTLTCWAFHHFGAENSPTPALCYHSGPEKMRELRDGSRHKMNHLVATMASVTPANMDRIMGRCCTHGLTIEMAKYLRGVRWTAAYEAMKILEGLSGIPAD